MIRLSVQSRLIPGGSLVEKYDTARALGFDGLELAGSPMIEAATEASREGVPVTALCSGQRGWFIDPDPAQIEACLEDTRRLLELSAALHAPLIVVPIYGRTSHLPSHCGTGRSHEEDVALWLDGLQQSKVVADAVGGAILVEAINRYENSISVRVADAARYARMMDSPNVRAMADVFHMNIEESDMEEALVTDGDAIGYIHLADSQRLEPGQGHLDLDGVFRGLHRIGFDGWASFECELSGPAMDVLPPAVAYVRERIALTASSVDIGSDR